MEILGGLATVISTPELWLVIFLAALIGMIVGATPGLTAAAAIAMLLPVTVFFEPVIALTFLYVIGKSGRYGGSIAAILFNTPGTAASAATQLDGYPLAQQGKAGKAMKVATVSSVIGDFMGDFLVIFGIGLIAALAIKLGPPETFAIYFAAFVVIGSVIGDSVIKGLISATFGMLIAMVGLDPISGETRYTMGIFELTNGVKLVPLMIGIFVLGEVFSQLEKKSQRTEINLDNEVDPANNNLTWAEYKPCLPFVFRGGLIGACIGVLPGLGSAIAAFISYGENKRRAKNADQWGKGALEGIAAPEAANNAVSGPSMAPLLTLGIPGSTIGAIMVGAFSLKGLSLDPSLFIQPDSRALVYQLLAAGLFGIVAYGLIGYYGASLVARFLVRISPEILYPVIFLTSFVAAYSFRNNLFDIVTMICAGFVGWIMRKFGYSQAAFVIAFVLAGGAEETLRQSLLLSPSGWGIFVERPIALAFICIGMGAVIFRIFSLRRSQQQTVIPQSGTS